MSFFLSLSVSSLPFFMQKTFLPFFFALVTRQSAVSGKMALMRPVLFPACLIESVN